MESDKDKLWKSWGYEFGQWISVMRSAPIELIKSADYSESYSMNRAHIFKLENRQYAMVVETGCSCYTCSDAKIELFPSKHQALVSFSKYVSQQEQYKSTYE